MQGLTSRGCLGVSRTAFANLMRPGRHACADIVLLRAKARLSEARGGRCGLVERAAHPVIEREALNCCAWLRRVVAVMLAMAAAAGIRLT
jgi:hypothetical protein